MTAQGHCQADTEVGASWKAQQFCVPVVLVGGNTSRLALLVWGRCEEGHTSSKKLDTTITPADPWA
jgi:hypothetical protein